VKTFFRSLPKLTTLFTIGLLTACGGGGSNNTPNPPPVVIDNIPLAVADSFTTDEQVAVTGNVSSNDTGLEDAPVTYEVETAPGSGSLSLTTSGQFTYTPVAGFIGEITFTYRVTDSDGDFDTATVTITVNMVVVDVQPVANDDSYTTAQNEVLSGNVSTNDDGLTDAPIAYSVVSQPSNGSLNLSTGGSFQYTPSAGFNGSDAFSYRVTDNDGDSDTANVDITITTTTTGVVWPTVVSEITTNVDTEVAQLLARMSTEEKVGQIIMAEIHSVTPEQAKTFNLGAVLNGGGSWPNNSNRSTAADWVTLADAYYLASTDVSDGGVGIPLIWGTDAVHGHNNVYGATILPHNIGLGAANNEALMEDIGRLTALQVLATGIDWTFAPTVATVRDDRWGRTYEGYSEDPNLVSALTDDIVHGLQGKASTSTVFDNNRIVATAKHFIGDGGTTNGIDQGNTQVDEQTLRDLHAKGFYAALNAGGQTVMASYNSWNGDKLHGNSYLLSDVLRDQIGFDGFVIGDWNGHAQVTGCSNSECATAINAGVDMIMVPFDWQNFYNNTLAQVQAGVISMARLDEAVTRILRVKFRSGLMSAPRPGLRTHAGDNSVLASNEIKTVARQAVRESLVLLKNKSGILPLNPNQNILVVGSAANNIGQQSGGWSITWQGDIDNNDDFPEGTSIFSGIQTLVSTNSGTATLSPTGAFTGTAPDVAIVVFGETPYSEGVGDLNSLEYQAGSKSDLALLNSFKSQGIPVVSIFISGRPLWVNAELNASDAFVAAWLPGTEGDGIAEVIFSDNNDAVVNDFRGKLSYSWPNAANQTPLNSDDANYAPLFELGYGLTYQDIDTLGDDLDEGNTGSGPTVFSVPADLIEAENFSAMSGIQLETTTDTGGGQNIGYVDVGDWLEYEIDVTTAGTYTIEYRLASWSGSGGFRTTINGVLAHIQSVPSTGGWQNWVTETQTVTLSAGRQTLRLDAIGNEWNMNWIKFVVQ